MTSPKRFAALVASLVLGVAATAAAQPPTLTAHARSTRDERPFSISLGTVSYSNGPGLVGVQAEYQVTDRVALGAELGVGAMALGASANTRFFLAAEPTSGLYAGLAAHAFGGMGGSALGGGAELGYQYRGRGGLLLELEVGLLALHVEECGCAPPSVRPPGPWQASPEFKVALGYTF
jgi:hypothetical protein